MYYYSYSYLIPLIVCLIFSALASSKVKSTFERYSKVNNRMCISGCDAAVRLLRVGGVSDVRVGSVSGSLTDHYHPTKAVVNLSESTYNNRSVAAVAVAAHEVGHVMQNKKGFVFYKIRTALAPVVNFAPRLAMPLVLIGILLDAYLATSQNSELGYKLALVGVVLYSTSFLFTLVTLPVELDASRRAKKMLLENGILREDEMEGADKVLSAAALTYLASLVTSLVYFLRFLMYVMRVFGRRRN